MNRMLAIVFIMACSAMALAGPGDMQVLSDILEERIKSRRPEWELLNKHVDDDAAVIQWQNASPEKETYLVVIKNTPSTAAAAKIFSQQFPNQAGNNGVEIQGVGQEARFYEIKPGARIYIEFREANFIVDLMAPSEPKGRRLAKYILDSIAALQHKK